MKHCAYSVPSRLIGEWIKIRLFEGELEVWYQGKLQLACERLRGRHLHRIDYRHVIWSLVRKPGGFARWAEGRLFLRHEHLATECLVTQLRHMLASYTRTVDRKQVKRGIQTPRRTLPADISVWIGGAGAESLGIDEEGARVVASWEAIDLEVARLRSRPLRRLGVR